MGNPTLLSADAQRLLEAWELAEKIVNQLRTDYVKACDDMEEATRKLGLAILPAEVEVYETYHVLVREMPSVQVLDVYKTHTGVVVRWRR